MHATYTHAYMHIGEVKVSLKDLLRDGKANEAGTCEVQGELEIMAPDAMAPKKLPKPAAAPPGSARSKKGDKPTLARRGSSFRAADKVSMHAMHPIHQAARWDGRAAELGAACADATLHIHAQRVYTHADMQA